MTGAQRAYVLLEPPRATRKLRLNPQIPIEQAEALLWVLCARDESTDKARLTTCASRRCLINIQFASPVQNQWLPMVSISLSGNDFVALWEQSRASSYCRSLATAYPAARSC